MTPTELEMLQQFKKLLKSRVNLHQRILFGSRARGDASPDSDMDVLVVVDDNDITKIRPIINECAWETCFGNEIILSPVVYTRDDWEKGPERVSLLAKAVSQEGVPV